MPIQETRDNRLKYVRRVVKGKRKGQAQEQETAPRAAPISSLSGQKGDGALRTITVANLVRANWASRPTSGACTPPDAYWCSWLRYGLATKFQSLPRRRKTRPRPAATCWPRICCFAEAPATAQREHVAASAACWPSPGCGAHPPGTAQAQHYRSEMMAAQLRSSPQWGQSPVIGSRRMRGPLVAANAGGATDSSRTFSHGPPSPLSLPLLNKSRLAAPSPPSPTVRLSAQAVFHTVVTQPWHATAFCLFPVPSCSHLQLRSFFSTHRWPPCAETTSVEPRPCCRAFGTTRVHMHEENLDCNTRQSDASLNHVEESLARRGGLPFANGRRDAPPRWIGKRKG